MKNSKRHPTARSIPPPKRDPRFQQLLTLAREGNEEAAADLFSEYGYTLQEGCPHDAG